MPGFGSGPFGSESFGEWKWSRQILFDYLPEIYRLEDLNNGGALETWVEGQRDSFDRLRRRIRDFSDLKDPLVVRTQFGEVSPIRLGRQIVAQADVEQRGVDGIVSATKEFVSPTGRFREGDVGKELTITNSALDTNNRTVIIASIVDLTSVKTQPSFEADVGLLTWDVREKVEPDPDRVTVEIVEGACGQIAPGWIIFEGLANFEVETRRQFSVVNDRNYLTEAEGVDGFVDVLGRFNSPTGGFLPTDVGKKLSLLSSSNPDNTGRIAIQYVVSSTVVLTSFEVIRGADSDGGVSYSVIALDELVRVEHAQKGLNTPLSVLVVTLEVGRQDITVNLETDGAGAVVSTATDVAAAVAADLDASVLVNADVTGSGASVAGASPFLDIGGRLLTQDPEMAWARLPHPQVQLFGSAVPQGVITQKGALMSVVDIGPPARLEATTAGFTETDIGNEIELSGSLVGNDGSFQISDVPSSSTLLLNGVTLALDTSLFWNVRTRTQTEVDPSALGGASVGTGDRTIATARAPSLITRLAKDFGIEVDTQESETRQRSWVRNVTRWINKKGHEDAYRIIGAISGFDVTTKQLFRITQDIYQLIPGPNLFEVGETDIGKFGVAGSLSLVSGAFELFDPDAKFEVIDIGRSIRVGSAGTASNNKLYTIASVPNDKTARFRILDTASLPDANNGALTWQVVRLYTDLPPLLPLYDEFVEDLMEELVDGLPPQTTNKFGVDKYCWEDDYDSSIPVQVNESELISGTTYEITMSGPEVITGVGNWKIVWDAPNEEDFYIETVPVATPTSKVQRGTVIFGAATDTTTFVLPDAVGSLTRAFARVTNVLKATGGLDAGSTMDKVNDDLGVTCLLTALDTVSFERETTGENDDYIIEFEVWEYTGEAGGVDEWGVVLHADVALAAGTASVDTAVVVTDAADVVPFVCGIRNEENSSTWDDASSTAQMLASDVRVQRGGTTGDTTVSIAVVEFIGSNWTVQEISHTFTMAGMNEVEAITSVGDWENGFITSSMRIPPGQVDDREVGWNVWPDANNTDQVFFRLRATHSDPTGVTSVAYVVQNAFMKVGHYDSITGGLPELPAGAASPQLETVNVEVVEDLANTAVIATADTFGATPEYPRGFWNYRMSTETTIEFRRGRHNAISDFAAQVIQFPKTLTFNVVALAVPTFPATATLQYDCPVVLSCDYCASSRVLAIIEAGDIASEAGQAIQKVLERVLIRLRDEPTPAHVELIPLFRQKQTATLTFTVTIQTP